MFKKLYHFSIKFDFFFNSENGRAYWNRLHYDLFVNFLPQMKNKDKRTKLMNEIIGGVKVSWLM